MVVGKYCVYFLYYVPLEFKFSKGCLYSCGSFGGRRGEGQGFLKIFLMLFGDKIMYLCRVLKFFLLFLGVRLHQPWLWGLLLLLRLHWELATRNWDQKRAAWCTAIQVEVDISSTPVASMTTEVTLKSPS